MQHTFIFPDLKFEMTLKNVNFFFLLSLRRKLNREKSNYFLVWNTNPIPFAF